MADDQTADALAAVKERTAKASPGPPAGPMPGRDVDWDWYRQATEQLDGMDRDALLEVGRRYAMSWAVSTRRAQAILRSTARGVEDGLRAYRRAVDLLDVHAKQATPAAEGTCPGGC